VVSVVAERMASDAAVSAVPGRTWTSVQSPPGAASPSPRAGHTGVAYGGKLWVFGGERASVAFNDVWSLDMKGAKAAAAAAAGGAVLGTWEYVVPASFTSPPPRHAHAAVVVGDKLFIHGGASGDALADAWAFDLQTLEWKLLTEASLTGARFGHSVAYVAGLHKFNPVEPIA
jgi:hypothetical protein